MNTYPIFMQGGVMMYVLVLIVLVLFGIVIRTLWHLYYRGGNDFLAIESCLDSFLFWGAFAVIVGFLGTVIGYHKAMSVVVARGLANPVMVWVGSAEGLVSSIAGLLVFMGAGACWYLFRWQYLRSRQASR